MPLTRCPYCRRRWDVPPILVETTIRCGDCARFFDADPVSDDPSDRPAVDEPLVVCLAAGGRTVVVEPEPAPPPEPEAADELPEPDRPPSVLTAPHFCHQSKCLIRTATGRRRATLACPDCNLVTSVYAVLHHCTLCGALLESPTRQAGQTVNCPTCAHPGTVPFDVLFAEGHTLSETGWIAFRCSTCASRLATGPEWAGKWAVCVGCYHPLSVPQLAKRAKPPRSIRARLDPWQVVAEPPKRRCKRCRHPLARHAVHCGYCGLAGR
jgi:hypothetical protein